MFTFSKYTYNTPEIVKLHKCFRHHICCMLSLYFHNYILSMKNVWSALCLYYSFILQA